MKDEERMKNASARYIDVRCNSMWSESFGYTAMSQ